MLEPLLMERGFWLGQGGDSDQVANLTFCIALDEFRDRWPNLLQAICEIGDIREVVPCIDLRVSGDPRQGITMLKLETLDLAPQLLMNQPHDFDAQIQLAAHWIQANMPTR